MNIKTEIKIREGLVINQGLPEGFVITDRNIFEKYGHLIKGRKFIIESGEKSKVFDVYLEIIKNLSHDSGDVNRIIAFGGGVVGDLAGFVASTYKRGVEFIQIPTSFISMVDSSIGGKNGVNLGERKNYIGTVYQPKEVLIDPLFLDSLNEKEFRNGVAEVIRYAVIFGKPSLLRLQRGLSKNDGDLKEIIRQCAKIKIGVVGKDERDLGYRHVLNFGHTIGHAIELIYGFSHGVAVSIGMLEEMKLGKLKGFFSDKDILDLRKALEVNGLPVKFPKDLDVRKVMEIMKQDKKGSFVFAFSRENYKIKLKEEDVLKFLENERTLLSLEKKEFVFQERN